MSEEQLIKDNLIRLITSGEESDLLLAIQLNIRQRLIDWVDLWYMFPSYIKVTKARMLPKRVIVSELSLVTKLELADILFSKRGIATKWQNYFNTIQLC